jgi:hypothetical protein
VVIAEPKRQVGGVCAGLLDRVVQDAGGDHVVRGAGLVEERGDLTRVLDERGTVGTAPLARMLPLGVGESGPRLWEPSYQIANAASTGHPRASLFHAGISEEILPACRATELGFRPGPHRVRTCVRCLGSALGAASSG